MKTRKSKSYIREESTLGNARYTKFGWKNERRHNLDKKWIL